jgi:hypothetical protein
MLTLFKETLLHPITSDWLHALGARLLQETNPPTTHLGRVYKKLFVYILCLPQLFHMAFALLCFIGVPARTVGRSLALPHQRVVRFALSSVKKQ